MSAHKEVKRGKNYRTHHCSHCRLGPLQRDLFSAFLARLCGQYPQQAKNLEQGPFNTAGYREQAERLCKEPSAPGPAPCFNGSRKRQEKKKKQSQLSSLAITQASIMGLAGKPVVQTPGQYSTSADCGLQQLVISAPEYAPVSEDNPQVPIISARANPRTEGA